MSVFMKNCLKRREGRAERKSSTGSPFSPLVPSHFEVPRSVYSLPNLISRPVAQISPIGPGIFLKLQKGGEELKKRQFVFLSSRIRQQRFALASPMAEFGNND